LGILKYLNKRDISEIAALDARVTHLWTQSEIISKQLAASCHIGQVVNQYIDMIGEVDAVIIARDDYLEHQRMAMPFLNAGIPVFIDKPLTLDLNELQTFTPYIESGLLMSCSGFRYCAELDSWRSEYSRFGNVRLIQASVVNDWNKYGIHMVDAILSLADHYPISVEAVGCKLHESLSITMSDGSLCQINAMGPDISVFSLSIFGDNDIETVKISDNFTAFKRTLFHFIEQVKTGKPSIKPSQTLLSINTMIAGRMALDSGDRVTIKSVER
jgi:predicted dehydrogenase